MTMEEMKTEVCEIRGDMSKITNSYGLVTNEENLKLWSEINERVCVLIDDIVSDFVNLTNTSKNSESDCLSYGDWFEKFSLLDKLGIRDFVLREYSERLLKAFVGTTTHTYVEEQEQLASS